MVQFRVIKEGYCNIILLGDTIKEKRGGFIGRGRGGFSRGRELIICYNCNQPGHLAYFCQNPCTRCT
jgi:hypothetical protein